MFRFILEYKILCTVAVISVVMISCANIGQGPQGGSYDFDAPVLVKAIPKHNTTNFEGNKIELIFDENIVIKEQNEKVIVTPPQRRMPIIKHANRKVSVELRDTLKENTTYTIDFTDAIRDNNQDNPLENFSISFSTGDVVDSLTVSGTVFHSQDLEPVKGYFVGLHSNLDDSAFLKIPFDRISRTNDRGEFTIRGIAPGKYHVFALNDMNRDYRYDSPTEAVAFYDVVLEPSAKAAVRSDTIYTDEEKTLVDSIKTVEYTEFTPNNLTLKAFLSEERREYFRNVNREGETANKMVLNFGAPTNKPHLESLNFKYNGEWGIIDRNMSRDSIYTYWIKDETIIAMDTLQFAMTYNMTDTLENLISKTDTIFAVNRQRKDSKKKKAKEKKIEDQKEEVTVFLEIKSNLKSAWDVYDNIEIEVGEPLKDSLHQYISFQQKVDTTYQDVDYKIEVDSLNPRKYKIIRRWKYDEEYKFSIDSAAVHSIYGLWNSSFEHTFKVKSENQYGALAITVTGINDSIPSFIELLDSSGKPFRKGKVIERVALFKNLNPGKYFAKLIIDRNGNNNWDTGDYKKKRQPEEIYYYPGFFELKAFWELEEVFSVDVNSTEKPLDILKNKPKDESAREKLLQEEDAEKYEQEKKQRRQEDDRRDPARALRQGRTQDY